MYQALTTDYPLTQAGQVMFETDYIRITKPAASFAVPLPGIYADVANTKDTIVNTNYEDGDYSGPRLRSGLWEHHSTFED